jgi:hypothetical protein
MSTEPLTTEQFAEQPKGSWDSICSHLRARIAELEPLPAELQHYKRMLPEISRYSETNNITASKPLTKIVRKKSYDS